MGHLIEDRKESDVNYYFNLLENFSVGIALSMAYLLAFFLVLTLTFLLDELTRRIEGRRRAINIPKRIVLALSKFRVKQRLTAIGLFVLLVQMFIWITQLFLTNNIKVEV